MRDHIGSILEIPMEAIFLYHFRGVIDLPFRSREDFRTGLERRCTVGHVRRLRIIERSILTGQEGHGEDKKYDRSHV